MSEAAKKECAEFALCKNVKIAAGSVWQPATNAASRRVLMAGGYMVYFNIEGNEHRYRQSPEEFCDWITRTGAIEKLEAVQ